MGPSPPREHWRAWPYELPCWVFTHRDLPLVAEGVRFASGDVREHHAAMAEVAGERGIWVAGGGDLAGQFADHGLLDQVVVSIAGATLGGGRPLFPRRYDPQLVETGRNGDFIVATYDVEGPRDEERDLLSLGTRLQQLAARALARAHAWPHGMNRSEMSSMSRLPKC